MKDTKVSVAIIGSSIAGLFLAALLSAKQIPVILVDKASGDLTGFNDELHDERTCVRNSVGQLQHSHSFLAKLTDLIDTHLPTLIKELENAGVKTIRYFEKPPFFEGEWLPEEGDLEIKSLAARRITFEKTLFQKVVKSQYVKILRAEVLDLLFTDSNKLTANCAIGSIPHVSGIKTTNGIITADFVIDASGRNSRIAKFLTSRGISLIQGSSFESPYCYLTQFFKKRNSNDVAAGLIEAGYLKAGIFEADRNWFSVTFSVPCQDNQLISALRKASNFTYTCDFYKNYEQFFNFPESTSTGNVNYMGHLTSHYQPWADKNGPKVLGLLQIGDAAIHTNPIYGRGCTFAFMMAQAITDFLAKYLDMIQVPIDKTISDLQFDLAMQWQRWLSDNLLPYYHLGINQDKEETQYLEDGYQTQRGSLLELYRYGFFPGITSDSEIFRAFIRTLNLIDNPVSLLLDENLIKKASDLAKENYLPGSSVRNARKILLDTLLERK